MRFLPLHDAPIAHGPAFEAVIREFYITGRSVHSTDGTLLAPLLNYLREAKIAFTLRYVPGGGYYVERGADPIFRARPPMANSRTTTTQLEIMNGQFTAARESLDRHRVDAGADGGQTPHGRDSAGADQDAAGDNDAAGGEDGRTPVPDAMSIVDVVLAHVQATKGTALTPEYLRLTDEEWQQVRGYAHRETTVDSTFDTLCGIPVEIIGSYEDRARQARGQVGFQIPREAIAPKE